MTSSLFEIHKHEMKAKLVIFDLDGTLLDTGLHECAESLVIDVAKQVLARHGAQLTQEAQSASMGKRAIESWQTTIDILGLKDVSAQQLFDESEPLLRARWPHAGLMPGASRLAHHLHGHKVPLALATSSLRRAFEVKLSGQASAFMRPLFQEVVCGDEVEEGKPAPDCFRKVAQNLGFSPEDCLVVEDAPAGVEAALAAHMQVVVVPSLSDLTAYPSVDSNSGSDKIEILPSLLDFQPQKYGLPPFEDLVHGVVPLHPVWKLRGKVVRGFGRGSKELGIPTANLDTVALQGLLAEAVTGIYTGFASVGNSSEVYKMCMSIGWNPFYKNEQKTVEPWLLHTFEKDFYDEELRLLICGYIRPETSFTSLDALIKRIHEDARVSELCLQEKVFSSLGDDPCLKPK